MAHEPSQTGGDLPDADLAERLIFYLRSLTGDLHLAEDLYHDLLVRNLALRKNDIQDRNAYYFRAARNIAFNALQSKNRAREAHLDWKDWRVALQSSSSRHDDIWEFQELTRALESLTPDDRELVLLKTHAELSFSEIVLTLGIPKSTVAERYGKALEQLKKALESADEARVRPLKGALSL